jgi:hypothetical protein
VYHLSNNKCYFRRFLFFCLQNVCDIPQDLDQKASDICNDYTTSPLKINHFTSVRHFDQSHAASASSMTVSLYRWRMGCSHNMCDIPEEQLQPGGGPVIFYTTCCRIRSKRKWYTGDSFHFASEVPEEDKSADLTLVIWRVIP